MYAIVYFSSSYILPEDLFHFFIFNYLKINAVNQLILLLLIL